MKKFILLSFLITLILSSCASYETSSYGKNKHVYNTSKKTVTTTTKKKNTTVFSKSNNTALKSNNIHLKLSSSVKTILNEAEKYTGTPYKIGGITKSGMDCSGLVYVSFNTINKKLPRRSIDMASYGNKISVSNVKEGDLIFFATSGGDTINHVGIVHDIGDDGEVFFIHASTSKGVMISSLSENYWSGKFIKATRVL